MKTAGRLLLAAVLFACLAVRASGQLLEDWVARYDGPGDARDEGWAVALGPDGSVYVTGLSWGGTVDDDYVTAKYDAYGNELWSARYDGSAHGSDWACGIAVDADGNAHVTGQSYGTGTGFDYVTIKYDTDGNREWVAEYDGPASASDWPWGIALDGRGGVYVAGRSWGGDSSYDYATVKYDTDGNEEWVARYDGPVGGSDVAQAITTDTRGNVYVSGKSAGGATSADYATIKYDGDGTELWVARYDGPASGSDGVYWGIAVDEACNVYVTGQSDGVSLMDSDFATVKYDSLGNELWSARYTGPVVGEDSGYDLAVGSDGSVYVIGRSWAGSHHFDYATVKYDADGNEEWVARYNGPGDDWDCPHTNAVDSEGNMYVTGQSVGDGTYWDCATIRYSSTGELDWVAMYDGGSGGEDYGWGLVMDGDGRVIVTGASVGSGVHPDCTTIAYWAATGLPDDAASTVELHPCTPNPFKGVTHLHFGAPPGDGPIGLNVYDVRGRLVKRLVGGCVDPGERVRVWDGTDERGARVPSGVYFVRLEAGGETATRKVVVLH